MPPSRVCLPFLFFSFFSWFCFLWAALSLEVFWCTGCIGSFCFFILIFHLSYYSPPKKTLYQIPPKRAVLNSHNNSSFNFFLFALCLGVLSELYNFIPDSWTFYVAGQRVLWTCWCQLDITYYRRLCLLGLIFLSYYFSFRPDRIRQIEKNPLSSSAYRCFGQIRLCRVLNCFTLW